MGPESKMSVFVEIGFTSQTDFIIVQYSGTTMACRAVIDFVSKVT
jgi:hypothetical protein